MYVSYKWLNEYVELGGISPEELAEKITKSGIEIEGIEYKSGDAILELDVLANRGDALSMLGVAYEVGAILSKPVTFPDSSVGSMSIDDINNYVSIDVKAKDLADYYGVNIIKGVTINPSPLWMQNYLLAAGIRPINNVVDITNFVMIEYGQPLHAFDFDKLNSNKIIVRRANEGEVITTLDSQQHNLDNENLVIANDTNPVAIAGVMGGLETEVTTNTRTILLESAYFNSSSIRNTVKQTGLRSESSTRFEKGVNPDWVKEASQRACHLLEEYADGIVLKGANEYDSLNYSNKVVEVDTIKVNKRLGASIINEDIGSILTRLQFDFVQNGNKFIITIPNRRRDIVLFEDILEEIARIYGYDNLPFTLPVGSNQVGRLTDVQRLKRNIREYLQGVGFMETQTYSLTNDHSIGRLISPEIRNMRPTSVKLSKPMSEDHKYLRLSLLPSLINSLSYNSARNQKDNRIYEVGSVFVSNEDKLTRQPDEVLRVSGAITGNWIDNKWQGEVNPVDFYVVKGIVEGLFERLNINVKFEQIKLRDMHPGRTALIQLNNQTIGFIGQLHPSMANEYDLAETYVFDINLDIVINAYYIEPIYKEMPKYPSTSRDVAFILDVNVSAGEVKDLIEETGKPLLKSVEVFDLYEGEHMGKGKKSIAYHLTYQDYDKTLVDEEVDESYGKIVEEVESKLGGYVRK